MLFRRVGGDLHPEDIVMDRAPEGDAEISFCFEFSHVRKALTFALPGLQGLCRRSIHARSIYHQEMIEILYHTLWESVHVFLEHRELATTLETPASLPVSWPGKATNP